MEMKRKIDDISDMFGNMSVSKKTKPACTEIVPYVRKAKRPNVKIQYENPFNFPKFETKYFYSRAEVVEILKKRDAVLWDKLLKYARADNAEATIRRAKETLDHIGVH